MIDRFYRLPPSELWQGDVFEVGPAVLVPQFHQEVLRAATVRGGIQMYQRYSTDGDESPPGGFRFPGDSEVVAIKGHRVFAVVLNHDCDFDKPGDHPKQIAMVRRLERPEDHPEIIEGRQIRAFYLPRNDEPSFPDSFVDFRHITTVTDLVLDGAVRLLSLSEDMRLAFRAAIARYFSREQERPLGIEAAGAR